MIDFTDCPIIQYRTYNGASGRKICVLHEGHRYMIKFPPKPKSGKRKDSSINSCISEHISCMVLKSIGMNVQDTILGTYHTSNTDQIVVGCRDFTEGGFTFSDFASLKNTCGDTSSNGYDKELSEIICAIGEQTWVEKDVLTAFFWDLFICDSL